MVSGAHLLLLFVVSSRHPKPRDLFDCVCSVCDKRCSDFSCYTVNRSERRSIALYSVGLSFFRPFLLSFRYESYIRKERQALHSSVRVQDMCIVLHVQPRLQQRAESTLELELSSTENMGGV